MLTSSRGQGWTPAATLNVLLQIIMVCPISNASGIRMTAENLCHTMSGLTLNEVLHREETIREIEALELDNALKRLELATQHENFLATIGTFLSTNGK